MQIIGQQKILSELSRVIDIFVHSKAAIRPHFILTGESGSGKSLIIQALAKRSKIGFIEMNGAALTKEGTSGNSLSKALSPLIQLGNTLTIVFVDEFDKLFISGNSNTEVAHETTSGVQNEFLKVLEADNSSVFGDYGKYVNASTKNCLFVFAGAFNNEPNITIDRLRQFGMKTEFLGRVGLVFNTEKLTLEDLYTIVDTSSLLTNYCELFENSDRESIALTIKGFIRDNYSNNTLGARVVNTLIHQYFIKGGKLTMEEVKATTFQEKLKLD